MPEGSKAICIKNRLLKRVIAVWSWLKCHVVCRESLQQRDGAKLTREVQGSEWEAATEVATGTNNMWIIVNDDVKGTITHFKDWKKKEKVLVRACLCVCGGMCGDVVSRAPSGHMSAHVLFVRCI